MIMMILPQITLCCYSVCNVDHTGLDGKGKSHTKDVHVLELEKISE